MSMRVDLLILLIFVFAHDKIRQAKQDRENGGAP